MSPGQQPCNKVKTAVELRCERHEADIGCGSLDFTHGKVTWTSGDNSGTTGWVRQWNTGSGLVDMVIDFPFDIEVGNGFNILAGCKKNRTDCAAYNNIDRYGGFDFVAR